MTQLFDKCIKIAIAEDHSILREGMTELLNQDPCFSVVCTAENGAVLLESLEHTEVDVILLDLEMPIMSGYEALFEISQKYPETRCLILSYFNDYDFIYRSFELGAKGYLSKNADIKTIKSAIISTYENEYYLNDIPKPILEDILKKSHDVNGINKDEIFSSKELMIIRLICSGKINKEIAEIMEVSVKTIENHRSTIFTKAEVKNIAELVVFAIKGGYYSLG
jgi:DNA-binding NarL/FixJ family response regulator